MTCAFSLFQHKILYSDQHWSMNDIHHVEIKHSSFVDLLCQRKQRDQNDTVFNVNHARQATYLVVFLFLAKCPMESVRINTSMKSSRLSQLNGIFGRGGLISGGPCHSHSSSREPEENEEGLVNSVNTRLTQIKLSTGSIHCLNIQYHWMEISLHQKVSSFTGDLTTLDTLTSQYRNTIWGC